MALEFIKKPNGNVIIERDNEVEVSFRPEAYVLDTKNTGFEGEITISTHPKISEFRNYRFDFNDVTTPGLTGLSKSDFITKLSEDYFFTPLSTAIGAGATEAKQDAQIVELQAIKANTNDNATATKQDAQTSELQAIKSNTATNATEAKQDDQITSLGTDGATPPTIAGTGIRGWLRGIYERVANLTNLTFTGGDLNVNASISMPAGLATEAKQDAQITELQAIKTNTSDNASETTLSAMETVLQMLTFTGGDLNVNATVSAGDSPFGDTGGHSALTPSGVSQQVLAADTEFKEVILYHENKRQGWVKFGAAAVVGEGFPIKKKEKVVLDRCRDEINIIFESGFDSNELQVNTVNL